MGGGEDGGGEEAFGVGEGGGGGGGGGKGKGLLLLRVGVGGLFVRVCRLLFVRVRGLLLVWS